MKGNKKQLEIHPWTPRCGRKETTELPASIEYVLLGDSPSQHGDYFPLGTLAHLLRMVLDPEYLAFRFGDYTPQSSSDVP